MKRWRCGHPRCRSKFFRAPLFIVFLFLSACASTQFFYNRLDTFIAWYLDDYVELNTEQSQQFKEALDQFFDWHRREELPQYVDFLARTEALLDDPLSAAQTDELALMVREAIDRIQIRVVDIMLLMAATLSEHQIAAFLEALQENLEEDTRELLDRDDEAFREESLDRLLDNLQRYLGKLSSEQKSELSDRVNHYRRIDAIWLQDRKAWLALLEEELTHRQPGWQARLRQAVFSRRNGQGDELDSAFDYNAEITRGIVRDTINSRTARQDRRLRKEIGKLKRDFVRLATDQD